MQIRLLTSATIIILLVATLVLGFKYSAALKEVAKRDAELESSTEQIERLKSIVNYLTHQVQANPTVAPSISGVQGGTVGGGVTGIGSIEPMIIYTDPAPAVFPGMESDSSGVSNPLPVENAPRGEEFDAM